LADGPHNAARGNVLPDDGMLMLPLRDFRLHDQTLLKRSHRMKNTDALSQQSAHVYSPALHCDETMWCIPALEQPFLMSIALRIDEPVV
jgi:hypothetical protein